MKTRVGRVSKSKKRRHAIQLSQEELLGLQQDNNHGALAKRAQHNPASLTADNMLQLQRVLGNRAVSNMVDRKGGTSSVIQRDPVRDRLLNYIADSSKGQAVNDLAAHLMAIMNAMDGGDYDTAYNLLMDGGVLKSLGHSSEMKFKLVQMESDQFDAELDKEILKAASTAMYFSQSHKLALPDIVVVPPNNEAFDPTNFTPANNERLAWMVLPIALEEWIHMFQHMIGGLVSPGTEAFEQTDEVQQNQALPDGGGRWNMREVDIYAIYRDLGWDRILKDFESRYTEREKYKQYDSMMKAASMPFGRKRGGGKANNNNSNQ